MSRYNDDNEQKSLVSIVAAILVHGQFKRSISECVDAAKHLVELATPETEEDKYQHPFTEELLDKATEKEYRSDFECDPPCTGEEHQHRKGGRFKSTIDSTDEEKG